MRLNQSLFMFTIYDISLYLWLKYSFTDMVFDKSSQGVLVDELLPYSFFCLTVETAILVLFVTDLHMIQYEHEKCCFLSFSAYSLYDCLHNSFHIQGKCRASYICSGHIVCYSSFQVTWLYVIKHSISSWQQAYNY